MGEKEKMTERITEYIEHELKSKLFDLENTIISLKAENERLAIKLLSKPGNAPIRGVGNLTIRCGLCGTNIATSSEKVALEFTHYHFKQKVCQIEVTDEELKEVVDNGTEQRTTCS